MMTEHIQPRFSALEGRTGLRIIEPIEEVEYSLYTPEDPSPRWTSTTPFYFPVGNAAEIETPWIQTPQLLKVWVRNDDGNVVAVAGQDSPASLPTGVYHIELGGALMKVYLLVESALRIEPDDHHVIIKFGDETPVRIGARSLHTSPAETYTTTQDPEDMFEVLSCLGAALKTTSAERSFPTLRGHPARIELGTEVKIPGGASPPDTGIEVTVPAEYEWLFPASPLAFYLGATLRAGDPAIQVGGARYPLGTVDDRCTFEEEVHTLLHHVFTLDCLVRTEGYYEVDLAERSEFEKRVDYEVDFARLYDLSPAQRLRVYMTIPYADTAEVRPQWPVTADVTPEAENICLLPFLLNDLALVRCPEFGEEVAMTGAPDPIADYLRGSADGNGSSDAKSVTGSSPKGETALRGSSLVRSARSESETGASPEPESEPSLISLPETSSISQTWVGDGLALGASKATVESYLRQLEHEPSSDPLTSVDVIINDEEMGEESEVTDIYQAHDLFEFDVDVHEGLTREELIDRFATETDFLHYVGHVDSRGMQCADGYLSAEQVENVACDAFFLNACRSYRQGQMLIERGALAGVVTLEEILNSSATQIGRHVARFINAGFSLQAALELIGEYAFYGTQYIVLGDGNAQIVQSASGTPTLVAIDRSTEDTFEVTLYGYPPRNRGPGAFYTPYYLTEVEKPYLNSGEMGTFTVSRDTLKEFLGRESYPIITDRSLHWSDELSLSDVP